MENLRVMMRRRATVDAAAICLALWMAAGAQTTRAAAWPPCPKPVEPCFKHHGRLSSQNGIALKIWLIGSTHVLGLDNDFDDLPSSIRKYLEMTSPDHSYIYGDFDICPTEPDTPRHLRRACLAGGENLVVQPLRSARPPFRLLSTWPRNVKSIP